MGQARKWIILVGVALVGCGGGTSSGDARTDMGGGDLGVGDFGGPDLGHDGGCTTDADGDGHRSTACGGDDCADDDANRYPGNMEVCDATNHDEDCDGRTFGFRDIDMDGYLDSLCCNSDGAVMHCGDDCSDASPSTHPTANETCNGRDDDCNGMIDDVGSVIYLDCDGDGYGDSTRSMLGCPRAAMTAECGTAASGAGWIAAGNDCDDAVSAVHPGAAEACNTVDDDCNTLVDDVPGGCACIPPATRSCGVDVGACHTGTQSCVGGHWETACGGAYAGPASETCNGVDDDCDGAVDLPLPPYPPPPTGLSAGRCYPTGATGLGATGMGIGACHAGNYRCDATGWSCQGAVTPTTASECGTDTRCNGGLYDGAACSPPGASISCTPGPTGYTGPACQPGSTSCSSVCALGTCAPSRVDWLWDGNDPHFMHGCGAAGGSLWCVGSPSATCHLTFFNYTSDFVPGRTYYADFNFAVAGGIASVTGIVNRPGGAILRSTPAFAGPLGPGMLSTVTVMFSVPVTEACENLEFILRTEGSLPGVTVCVWNIHVHE